MKKKFFVVLLVALVVLAFAACGGKSGGEWTREGFFEDENGDYLSITYMDDVDEPGWYVGFMAGDDLMGDSYGGMLQDEGGILKGILNCSDGNETDYNVTVTEEGETGVAFEFDGDTYHFLPMDMPEATIFVTINTEGWGNIEYAPGEDEPEVDTEYPYQSAQINLAEPETYTFLAWPEECNRFVKWTKNGEDFSTDPVITVLLDESADYVAWFEETDDVHSVLASYVGQYQCDRAALVVKATGGRNAEFVVEWSDSAYSIGRWTMSGEFVPDLMEVMYSDCTLSTVTYNQDGTVQSEEVLNELGMGTFTFNEDGTITWNDDQNEYGEMVFERIPD